jgi:hypothetical protein
MRFLTTLLVAGVLLSAWARAQEQPREGEKPPEKERPPTPTPAPPPCGVTAPPGCPNIKILWFDRYTPVSVLDPREVITWETVPSLDVVYKIEKQVVEELVVKSREVQQPYTCTTYVPVKVTDPHTGHCTTVMEARTEVKMHRDGLVRRAGEARAGDRGAVPGQSRRSARTSRNSAGVPTELAQHGGAMKIEAGETQKPLYLHTPSRLPCSPLSGQLDSVVALECGGLTPHSK